MNSSKWYSGLQMSGQRTVSPLRSGYCRTMPSTRCPEPLWRSEALPPRAVWHARHRRFGPARLVNHTTKLLQASVWIFGLFFAGLTRGLFGFSLPSRIFDVVVFTLPERAVSEKHVVHIFDLSNDQMVCSPIVAVFCGQTGFGRPHWCLPPGHSEPTNSVGGVGTPISKVFPANAAAFGLISGANLPHPILCSSGYAPMTIRAHPFTPGSVIF